MLQLSRLPTDSTRSSARFPTASSSAVKRVAGSMWSCSSSRVRRSSRGGFLRWRARSSLTAGSGWRGRRRRPVSRPISASLPCNRSALTPASSTTRSARSTTRGPGCASSIGPRIAARGSHAASQPPARPPLAVCGRFVSVSSPALVAEYFGVDEVAVDAHEPDYNVTPRAEVYAVRERDGSRQLRLVRWGLIPSWADDERIGDRLINARAESLVDKPAYRSVFERRRCLIPADGFYEWGPPPGGGRQKQPVFVHRRDGEPTRVRGPLGGVARSVGRRRAARTVVRDRDHRRERIARADSRSHARGPRARRVGGVARSGEPRRRSNRPASRAGARRGARDLSGEHARQHARCKRPHARRARRRAGGTHAVSTRRRSRVPAVEFDAYLDAIERESAALRSAATRGPLDAVVPTCPDWTLEELVGHVRHTQRWAMLNVQRRHARGARTVRGGGRRRPKGEPSSTRSRPPPRSFSPRCETPVPRPLPGRSWVRRSRGSGRAAPALEIAMHRWDGENAVGIAQPIDAPLTVDGIDEFLDFGPVFVAAKFRGHERHDARP